MCMVDASWPRKRYNGGHDGSEEGAEVGGIFFYTWAAFLHCRTSTSTSPLPAAPPRLSTPTFLSCTTTSISISTTIFNTTILSRAGTRVSAVGNSAASSCKRNTSTALCIRRCRMTTSAPLSSLMESNVAIPRTEKNLWCADLRRRICKSEFVWT